MRLSNAIRLTSTVLCAAVALPSVSAAVEVTALGPQAGGAGGRGIVILRCSSGRSMWRISRGTVLELDLGDSDHDIVLTAAHGLSPRPQAIRRDCRILSASGRAHRIEAAWHAVADGLDTGRDWAVLLVERRLEGDVGRLRPGHVAVDAMRRLASEEAPIRLLSVNPDLRERDCNMLPFGDATLGAREAELIMFYSCLGAPGLSGSPIIARVEGQPLVIGVHVGRAFKSMEEGRVRLVGVGHPIDGQVVLAIAAAVARARQ